MKRTAKIATMVSGGAIAVGAFAVPALASGFGGAPASQPASQVAQQVMDRQGPVNGQGNGIQLRTQDRIQDRTQLRTQDGTQLRIRGRDGTCVNLPASGTLTASQRAELVSMALNEKLTHDLYAQFYQAYHLRVFDNVAAAENNHLQALRTLMARYGITDPTAGQPAGNFGASSSAQATYDRLLSQGKASEQAALNVASGLENDAISSYGTALNGLSAQDAVQVLQNLKAAETRHLAAFSNWIAR